MEIKKLLNGIGIKVFIDYFKYFNNKNLDVSEIIEILPSTYTEKSRKSKISKARIIIRDSRLNEALIYILDSKRIDDITKNKAKLLLLNKENK